MEITITDVGQCRKKVKLLASAEEIQKEYTEKFEDIKKNVNLKGFRKGKVPASVLENRFGKSILEEMKYNFLQKAFQSAIEEHKLKPMGQPRFEGEHLPFSKDKEFSVEFILDIQPEFEIPDYSNFQWIKESNEATEEDMNHFLEEVRSRKGEIVLVKDDVSQEKDLLIATVEIKAGDTSLYLQKNMQLLVDDIVIKGIKIEKSFLIGHKTEDVWKKTLILPQEYETENDRGKEVELIFTLSEIKRLQLPPLDEKFAKEIGFENLEELKTHFKQEIELEKEYANNQQAEHLLLHQMVEEIKIEFSPEFIEERIKQIQSHHQEEEKKEKTEEEKQKEKEEIKKHLLWYLKEDMIISSIAEKEKIDVDEEEINAYIKAIARMHKKWPTEIKKEYEESGYLDEIRYKAKVSKVLQFLKDKVKLVNADDPDKKNVVCEH